MMDEVVNATFEKLKNIYDSQKEYSVYPNSRLIFPTKRGCNDLRLSEQELRFAFIEEFNNYCKVHDELIGHVFYGIEVPTKDKYLFKDDPKIDDDGQSAMFDTVIYDLDSDNGNLRRRILIEFKAANPEMKSYAKDFVKLENVQEYCDSPIDTLCYFIQILEGCNPSTISSIKNKCKGHKDIIFKMYSLKNSDKNDDLKDVNQ